MKRLYAIFICFQMKIAIYSRPAIHEGNDFITEVILFLKERKMKVMMFQSLMEALPEEAKATISGTFASQEELSKLQPDFLFSIGGDGTFIDAANIVGDSRISILGINTGRIGFLTHVNRNNFQQAINYLRNNDFQIEERALLQVVSNGDGLATAQFALNDISIHPSGESINEIRVRANGAHLNTYWGDGLIVATPTGSTAYSLSCGGPILVPTADVIALTPIASHSLTVRPIVLPASNTLEIKVESRSQKFILSVDSHRITLNDQITLTITKAPYTIATVRLPNADFYSVIREKLLWGLDKRNHNDHD